MNLAELEKTMKSCTKCRLSEGRLNVVPGEGSPDAKIMFIGEGPGKNEDEQGRPFVGAAGKLLTQMLESIGMKREDVYIANVVKCRPPSNRDPQQDEVDTCWPWLEKQLETIKPILIVPLGRHSLARFIPSARISADHGRALRKDFPPLGKVVFLPCYHPAAALYNGGLRETLFKDFRKIPKVLELIEKGDVEEEKEAIPQEKEDTEPPKPQQGSLF